MLLGVSSAYLGLFYPTSGHFRPYQIVTHMFMHGNETHLLFNMIGLFFFGRVAVCVNVVQPVFRRAALPGGKKMLAVPQAAAQTGSPRQERRTDATGRDEISQHGGTSDPAR